MITSLHNPKLQRIRKLQSQVKARREAQAFVIEGVRLAEEALHTGWEAQQVLFTDRLDARGLAVVEGFAARGVVVEQISENLFTSVSDTETPQGLLAVLALRPLPFPSPPNYLLILDGIRNPGNLGTILRTAAAAGVQAVLLTPGCTDAYAPKVMRSAMGAHFRLPIQHQDWVQIRQATSTPQVSLRVYLADAAHGIPFTQADFHLPLALIIGGEASGAGEEACALAHERVHIPMPGGSESLNAAVAASLLMFEVVRQRGTQTRN